MPQTIQKRKRVQTRYLLVFCLAFAVLGGCILLWLTHASNPNLLGDENNDGVVNVLDLSILLSHWNTNDTGVDLNGDGKVDITDLSILLSHWNQIGTPSVCSGVTKNANGSYSFARLKINSGHFTDQNGCTVELLGLNEGNFFTGAANADTPYFYQHVDFLKSAIHENVLRVNFQTRWWNDDDLVPDANMHFRQWLEQYITKVESDGNYVELDVGPQYFEPPCGGGNTNCPNQSQGTQDYLADSACKNASRTCPEAAGVPGGDESVPLQAITDIGKLYANDPAVIMDIWNEPLDSNPLNFSPTEYVKMMNTRINTFRGVAPNTPVVVYSYQIMNAMAAGKIPPYTQPNLAVDIHNYSASLRSSDLLPSIQYFESQNWAVILNEFGGSTASETALQTIQSLASTNAMGAAYFESGNLFDATNKQPPPYTLNGNGLLVQKYYKQILPQTGQ